MNQISVLEKTKDYIVVRIPRRVARHFSFDKSLSKKEALKILRAGMSEYKRGKTKKLKSLRDLRHGN